MTSSLANTTIILSAGESVRFDGPFPKQHIEIDGERLIDRTLRLFPDAYLVTHNTEIAPNYTKVFNPSARRYTSETLLSTQSLWREEITVLFGDVYYTDHAVRVIKESSSPINFFTDGQDIFGLKFKREVNLSGFLASVIEKASNPDGNYGRIWEVYRAMFGLDHWPATRAMPALTFIGDKTQDFDTMEDLNNFNKGISKNFMINTPPPEFNPRFLIRTYERDKEWLMYCLESIRKWEPDIPITAVAPVGHNVGCPVIHVEPKNPYGYIDQQYTKLNADFYVPPTTSHVIHIDSDCLMIGKLSGMFMDGKPMMLKTPYSQLDNQAKFWQGVTAHYMGFNPEYEYMRRMPLVYPIGIYAKVRDYLTKRLGPCEEWFPKIEGRKLSEFNILGAYAERFMPEEFHWIDTSKEELPPLVARQGWSWGGLDAVRAEWKELMAK